jgi:hypothetical protein
MLSRQFEMIKWILGVAITVAGILALSWVIEEEGGMIFSRDRKPSSIQQQETRPQQPSKAAILESGRDQRKPQLAKASGILEVEITSPEKTNVQAGSVLSLEAKVESLANTDDLKFAWILPAGVTIVSGPQEGTLGSMAEGQSTVIRLAVQTQTAENRQIHLNVFKLVDGEPLGKVAQFNTVDQASIEAAAKSKAEILQSTSASTETHQKVMQ